MTLQLIENLNFNQASVYLKQGIPVYKLSLRKGLVVTKDLLILRTTSPCLMYIKGGTKASVYGWGFGEYLGEPNFADDVYILHPNSAMVHYNFTTKDILSSNDYFVILDVEQDNKKIKLFSDTNSPTHHTKCVYYDNHLCKHDWGKVGRNHLPCVYENHDSRISGCKVKTHALDKSTDGVLEPFDDYIPKTGESAYFNLKDENGKPIDPFLRPQAKCNKDDCPGIINCQSCNWQGNV